MRQIALILLIPLALSAQLPMAGRGAVPQAGRGNTVQAPPPPPPTPAGDLATVEGQVVNAQGGTPLRKASVTLNRQNNGPLAPGTRTNFAATTDASGRFTFTGVEPGTYRLNASHTGYLQGSYNARKPGGNGTPIDIGKAQRMTNVILKLTPHGVVAGKITDEDGDPVENAQVQILQVTYGQGKKQLQQLNGESSNDLGEYRLAGLTPGKYYLSATYRRRMVMPMVNGVAIDGAGAPQEDYVTSFYPGTTDISAAVPIEMGPGDQVTGINVRLSKLRTVRVLGRVTNNVPAAATVAPPAPPPPPPGVQTVVNVNAEIMNATTRAINGPGMQVRLQQRNGLNAQSMMNTQVKPDGTFEFPSVPPGSYNIVALTLGAKPHANYQELNVGNSNVEGVNLSINPGTSVTGHIRFETDPPQPPNLQVRLSLRAGVGGLQAVPAPAAVKVDASGNFRFDDVNPEQYNVNINPPQGYYVKSIRAGNTDVLLSGLNLATGAGAIEITMAANPPTVGGTVTNADAAQPAPAVTVVLIPQDKERQGQPYFYNSATTDQYGAFSFNRVTPGDYKVYAWEDVQSGQWYDPDFMKQYESKGESVSAREGNPVTVKLTMIPVK